MKRLLAIILAALCATAHAQTTSITVLADTNRVVRTNFTIGNAQVTGLSGLLDGKLATNGNAASLTNLTGANVVGTVATASNITGILAISNGGTGSTSASNARTALGLGSAATNAASAFQPASATLTNLANGDGSGLTNVSGASNPTGNGGSLTNLSASNIVGSVATTSGGTGGTNAASGIRNLLPSYTNNAGKVLAVATNETSLEWITASGGGGGGGSGTVTSVDASGGSTGMNFTGGPITTNGTLTLGGTLAIGSGGTGASDVTNARSNLLPSYSGNAGKVLALNTNGTDLIWESVATGVVAVSSGGTGATNASEAAENLALTRGTTIVRILNTNNTAHSVAIGDNARVFAARGIAIGSGTLIETNGDYGIAIGDGASAYSLGSSLSGAAIGRSAAAEGGGAAIGYLSYVYGDGAAVGKNSYAENGAAVGEWANAADGFAGGKDANASATNSIQLGSGNNSSANTIQIYEAGTISTNEWSKLAELSTYPTTNIQVTVVGGATNTLVFTNGILMNVTSP